MNVQLSGNSRLPRSVTVTTEHRHAVATRTATMRPPGFAAEEEHKMLVVAFFSWLAGWIILNSGWSTSSLGYPLMVVGMLLPLVPAIARIRVYRQSEQIRLAIAALEAQGKGRTGRGLVYELNSSDYADSPALSGSRVTASQTARCK